VSRPLVATTTSVRIHPSGRPALISFPPRGEAAIAAAKAAEAVAGPAAQMSARFDDAKPSPPGTIAYTDLPARFRPKLISDEEIEAVEMGGAGYIF